MKDRPSHQEVDLDLESVMAYLVHKVLNQSLSTGDRQRAFDALLAFEAVARVEVPV